MINEKNTDSDNKSKNATLWFVAEIRIEWEMMASILIAHLIAVDALERGVSCIWHAPQIVFYFNKIPRRM